MMTSGRLGGGGELRLRLGGYGSPDAASGASDVVESGESNAVANGSLDPVAPGSLGEVKNCNSDNTWLATNQTWRQTENGREPPRKRRL